MSCLHDGCSNEPKQPKGFFTRTAFCEDHRKLYSNDVLEIITYDNIQRFQSNTKEAEYALSLLPETDIRLDLHGVLDLTEYTDVLVEKNISVCGISYVGNMTATRIQARVEFQSRIKSGQVQFGLLVFRRGRRKGTSEERNSFHDPGSKAWANTHIKLRNNGMFVDDSTDHVESVKSKKIPGMKSVHFNLTRKKLIEMLMKFRKSKTVEKTFELSGTDFPSL
jgi:hypothetical protein